MTGETPESEKDQAQPSSAPAEKAGFKTAAEEPETETRDPLAAQEEVDAAAAERLQEQEEDTAPVPAAQDDELLLTDVVDAPLSDDGAAERARAEAAQKILENAQCLAAIAALYERKDLLLGEYLPDLTLLAQSDGGLFVQSADNQFTVAPSIIQAEQEKISARAAFEMALLAMNNPGFNAKGIELTGNLRDRYMLSLAAAHTNLNVTNPVNDADVPEEMKAEFALMKLEWDALLENPPGGPQAEELEPAEPAVSSSPAPAEDGYREPAIATGYDLSPEDAPVEPRIALGSAEDESRPLISRGAEESDDLRLRDHLADAVADRRTEEEPRREGNLVSRLRNFVRGCPRP